MGAYLIDNPPAVDQWYEKRNRPLTGCTVLHTAEGVLDTIGPDTGAENTADFIRRRTTYGSYHDLVDSDSWVPLIPYQHGAFHDGTGSNNWALSISFACATSDWRAMSPEKRRGFLRQGARAFAAQQAWRKANGFPLTELRLISKAQSDRGESGFTYHGLRDPGRRTDPGVTPPNLFPFDEWLAECLAALTGTPTPVIDPRGPEMRVLRVKENGRMYTATDTEVAYIGDPAIAASATATWGEPKEVSQREVDVLSFDANARRARQRAEIVAAVASQVSGTDVDEQALGQAVIAGLLPQLTTAFAVKTGLTREDVEQVVRGVFSDAAGS